MFERVIEYFELVVVPSLVEGKLRGGSDLYPCRERKRPG